MMNSVKEMVVELKRRAVYILMWLFREMRTIMGLLIMLTKIPCVLSICQ